MATSNSVKKEDFPNTLLYTLSERGQLRDRFQRLWGTMEGDAVLNLSDGDLEVHNFVLSLSSRYFDKALNGSFKEGKTRAIDLKDSTIRATVIRNMVRMLYMHPYPIMLGTITDQLRCDVEMHAAGQYFLADNVIKIAEANFEIRVGRVNDKDGVAELLEFVELFYGEAGSDTSGLRKILLSKLSAFARELSQATDDGSLKDVLDTFPEFASDFAIHLCKGKGQDGPEKPAKIRKTSAKQV